MLQTYICAIAKGLYPSHDTSRMLMSLTDNSKEPRKKQQPSISLKHLHMASVFLLRYACILYLWIQVTHQMTGDDGDFQLVWLLIITIIKYFSKIRHQMRVSSVRCSPETRRRPLDCSRVNWSCQLLWFIVSTVPGTEDTSLSRRAAIRFFLECLSLIVSRGVFLWVYALLSAWLTLSACLYCSKASSSKSHLGRLLWGRLTGYCTVLWLNYSLLSIVFGDDLLL